MSAERVFGYAGKILRVDLSTGSISTEPTEKYTKKWLGGRGINMQILYDELKPWMTPYEPANRMVLGSGPLTGTLAPGSCRLDIASKNPFSNGVGTSNVGGFFAPELKYAGYDHIVLKGKAKKPVYLWIHDDHVELRDARALWGCSTWDAYDLIREQMGDEDIQVLSIGPAGENLVRSACLIANRSRAAGKCGMGGIMGSKNLKAIAVRGTGYVEVANPDGFVELARKAWQGVERSGCKPGMSSIGTVAFVPGCKGLLTTYKNFQDLDIPDELLKELGPETLGARYQQRQMGCMLCPLHCSNFHKIDEGPYAGVATEGYEMNTTVDFGTNIALYSAAAMIKIHALCSELGMDVDATSGPISWAFDCYERGILNREDTDGLELKWGNHDAVCELLQKIAYRIGFGDILAEGAKRAADIIGRGSEYYAMHQKGQDLYEDLRVPVAWALGTALSTRAGGHTTSSPGADVLGGLDPEADAMWKKILDVKTVDPMAYEDKAKFVIFQERQDQIMNSTILCLYVGVWFGSPANLMTLNDIAEVCSVATGRKITEGDLIQIADRTLNLEKAFNVLHANLGRADDLPQDRFFDESIKSGPFAGFQLSREKFNGMLDEYYALRGWDPETGLQTKECLSKLDLVDVAKDLERVGKIVSG